MSISPNKPYSSLWEWAVGVTAVTLPYIAWSSAGGTISSPYSVFPLLGVWAWTLMWTHYMYGTLSLVSGKFKRSKVYKSTSAYLVLAFILLHPGLLIYRLYEDTGMRPPESYISYVGEQNQLFIFFGTISLVTFLSYEIFKRIRAVAIVKRMWFWISISQAIAMILIFIHGLKLGSHLYGGWFQAYWVLLGCLLIPCFAVILRYDWRDRT
jgi:hypothetical protein